MTLAVYPQNHFVRVTCVHPQTLDADGRTVEGPLVHIAITPCRERFGTDFKGLGWKHARRWKYPRGPTYTSEFAQALARGSTGRFEAVENLFQD